MQAVHLRKYGVATNINFELYEVDGINFRVDAVPAAGDLKIMKDNGTEANTATTTFVDEGTGYSQALSATEMQAARIVLYVVDQTGTKAWLDKSIVIETYGNASAQHAFDLGTASTAQTGDSYARIGAAGVGLTGIAAVGDVTNLSNLPTIPANWLTAAGTAADFTTEIQNGLATPTNITAATGIVLSGVTHTGAVIPTVSAVTGLTASNLDATVSSRMATTHIDATAGKVDGVALADTTTTNTDMRGTDSANTVVPDAAGTAATPAAVATALTDIHLDHLMAVAAADVVVDGSVIAHMVSATEDWSTFVPSTDALQAIRDRGDAEWTTGGGASANPAVLQNTTIATLASQVSFTLTAGSADDDAYNNQMVVITDQSTSTQKCYGTVSDYVGSTKTVTLDADPGVFTFATGDTIDIIAVTGSAVGLYVDSNGYVQIEGTANQLDDLNDLTAAQVNTEVDAALTDYDAPTNTEMVAAFTEIKGATWSGTDTLEGIFDASGGSTPAAIADAVWDEVQSGHVTAGTFGLYLDSEVSGAGGGSGGDATEAKQDIIIAAVKTNAAGTDIAADIIALKSETVNILADTGELQTNQGDWATITGHATAAALTTVDNEIATMQGNVTDILGDTNELQGDDVPGLIAALDAVVDTVKAETVLILEDTADIQPNYATEAKQDTAKTAIDGIKTKTDDLTFTKADELDVNVLSINDVTLTGNGGSTPYDV